MSDAVNHPPHYKGFSNGAEVIDITENLNFNLGNVVKYVARAGRKTDDPVEDLRKAQWYLGREIERITQGGGRRFWSLLDHIPPDVVVEDCDGDRWRRVGGTGHFEINVGYGWESALSQTMRHGMNCSPFREVIDD